MAIDDPAPLYSQYYFAGLSGFRHSPLDKNGRCKFAATRLQCISNTHIVRCFFCYVLQQLHNDFEQFGDYIKTACQLRDAVSAKFLLKLLVCISFSRLIWPILWGHSGPLCHALSLSLLLSSLSWISMRRRRATVAIPGE